MTKSCCRGVGRALDSCDAGGSSATSATDGRGDGDGGAASGTDSTDGRRDEATDGGRDSGGASSDEKRTADVARETRAADGGTLCGGAAFLRCEKTSDWPEAAAATPDASPPNSATSVARAFTTRLSLFSRKVRLR